MFWLCIHRVLTMWIIVSTKFKRQHEQKRKKREEKKQQQQQHQQNLQRAQANEKKKKKKKIELQGECKSRERKKTHTKNMSILALPFCIYHLLHIDSRTIRKSTSKHFKCARMVRGKRIRYCYVR